MFIVIRIFHCKIIFFYYDLISPCPTFSSSTNAISHPGFSGNETRIEHHYHYWYRHDPSLLIKHSLGKRNISAYLLVYCFIYGINFIICKNLVHWHLLSCGRSCEWRYWWKLFPSKWMRSNFFSSIIRWYNVCSLKIKKIKWQGCKTYRFF